MKIKYLKLKNWLLLSLAGLLGINLSCDQDQANEYGCPEALFKVKGSVTDSLEHPLAGIQVEMDYNCDTTDENGRYEVQSWCFPGDVNSFEVIFSDIDSTENGLYKSDTVPVVFQRSELTGGDGHWYKGSATKEIDEVLYHAN